MLSTGPCDLSVVRLPRHIPAVPLLCRQIHRPSLDRHARSEAAFFSSDMNPRDPPTNRCPRVFTWLFLLRYEDDVKTTPIISRWADFRDGHSCIRTARCISHRCCGSQWCKISVDVGFQAYRKCLAPQQD